MLSDASAPHFSCNDVEERLEAAHLDVYGRWHASTRHLAAHQLAFVNGLDVLADSAASRRALDEKHGHLERLAERHADVDHYLERGWADGSAPDAEFWRLGRHAGLVPETPWVGVLPAVGLHISAALRLVPDVRERQTGGTWRLCCDVGLVRGLVDFARRRCRLIERHMTHLEYSELEEFSVRRRDRLGLRSDVPDRSNADDRFEDAQARPRLEDLEYLVGFHHGGQ